MIQNAAERLVWLTTSEAGVLRVWNTDPRSGWGYRGPAVVPAEVVARYERAKDEFWAASRALASFMPEADD